MKKQFFLISALLLGVLGLSAASTTEVKQEEFDNLFRKLIDAEQDLFDQAFGINHKNVTRSLYQILDKAHNFILTTTNDNVLRNTGEELYFTTITDLIQLLNAIYFKAPYPNALNKSHYLASYARKIYDEIYPIRFTSLDENNAKELILNMARFLEDSAKSLIDKYLETPPTRPVPSIPGRPSTRPLPSIPGKK